MRRFKLYGLVASLTLVAMLATKDAAADPLPTGVGHAIANFELEAPGGKTFSLDHCPPDDLVVVAFVGVDCPLVKLYAPRLIELAEIFASRGVTFIAIDSNRQDSLAEMAAFAKSTGLNFPLVKDTGNAIADRFGAQRTPEVFVLDRHRVVRYRGRIDDQYGYQTGVGFQRSQPTDRDLAVALEQLLGAEKVTKPLTSALGCYIGRARPPQADSPVTYSNQIARILQKRCVECHRPGEVAPFSLLTYDEVAGWGEMIREVVDQQRMPPWGADPHYGKFLNDPRLGDDEKQQLAQWVEAGCPEGDPADLPAPRQFVDGWQIGEPDQIVRMSDTPFAVAAEGTIEYQWFEVDPGFTEDKWIAAAEARPGNRAVVHHIIVFIIPPGTPKQQPGSGPRGVMPTDLLAGFAPGSIPSYAYRGMARRIPAGSRLLFQLHYTANGKATEDLSYLGIKFADPNTVEHDVRSGFAVNLSFVIPAGADNHQVTATRRLMRDTWLLGMMPHMHVRGKSFRYEAIYPDGKREILLDVPRYDFNWQLSYILPEPLLLPKGSKLLCTAHYDNSADNLANPDASKEVRWGDQTWEEMMIGWMITADPNPLDRKQTAGAGGQ